MMLRVIVQESVGAGAVNEDRAGSCAQAAWVIDGASGVMASQIDALSDAAWFAAEADRGLQQAFRIMPSSSTRDILRWVMARCREAALHHLGTNSVSANDLPSAAFAMVRVSQGRAEFTTLGDCRILYHAPGGPAALFGETALSAIEARTIALAREILTAQPDIAPALLREKLLPQLRENRRRMNQPGGYWIMGCDPDAADHVDSMTVEGDRLDCAIASDGFLRLIDTFECCDPSDLMDVTTPQAFAAMIARLRMLEHSPGSMLDYPRVKVSDDASFIRLTLSM
ncbi:protein phosphatase 2C domain-containing protein [Sphingobium algorifonticola]|nr:protein phosphatase 2C domain-containing protein [Sphingobium algorifonticola]